MGNGNGPLWTNVTVASGGVTNTGGLIVPDDRQALLYDLDGNLTFDGTWSYTWDAENRLRTMTMTNVAGIANSNRLRLEFTYDHQGRRVEKVVKRWTGSTFANAVTNRFVYDLPAAPGAAQAGGWNLIAEVGPSGSLVRSYVWGLDLSGTMEDAGGIGGLLLVTCHSSPVTNCFVAYDGNGNVTALVKGGNDPIAARCEYSPFGETLRATGPLAKANPFRFSTKFADGESGLVYYGYRYYAPGLGRFVNRDPIEEEGGNSLYGFAVNDPLNHYDTHGHSPLLIAAVLVLEVGLAALDTYELYDTLTDPEATTNEKLLTAGGFALGTAAPGGGYSVIGRRVGKEFSTQVTRVVKIRNKHLAGKLHPKTGIPFDKDGFPDFSSVAKQRVSIKQTGNRAVDEAAANSAAGLSQTPRGYTWHHHQDGKTMQLVPTDIHRATGHTGGVATGGG